MANLLPDKRLPDSRAVAPIDTGIDVVRGREPEGAEVISLPFTGDERALLEGMRAGHTAAIFAFCDRYGALVARVLARMLGTDAELEDLHHEVFARALRAAPGVKEPGALGGWITTIAVNVARTELKRRARRRWLTPLWGERVDVEAPLASDEDVEALRRTYAVLDRLSVDLRIPFALRVIEGMELAEVAAACEVSLATVKRRLARAEARFLAIARKDPVLAVWLTRGTRWNDA
jgi:RNA polymerase sigma-70 factor, ECF subfamily